MTAASASSPDAAATHRQRLRSRSGSKRQRQQRDQPAGEEIVMAERRPGARQVQAPLHRERDQRHQTHSQASRAQADPSRAVVAPGALHDRRHQEEGGKQHQSHSAGARYRRGPRTGGHRDPQGERNQPPGRAKAQRIRKCGRPADRRPESLRSQRPLPAPWRRPRTCRTTVRRGGAERRESDGTAAALYGASPAWTTR